MNIPAAIKNLNSLHECLKANTDQGFLIAIKLGIEALKAWQALRNNPGMSFDALLPGETKEC